MRIPRSNFSIATSDRFAVSAEMREEVSAHQVMHEPKLDVTTPVSGEQSDEVSGLPHAVAQQRETMSQETVPPAPLSYAPAVITEVVTAPAEASVNIISDAFVSAIQPHPLRNKQMNNNFAVKHWMDQDMAAKAQEQSAVDQPSAQPVMAPATQQQTQAATAQTKQEHVAVQSKPTTATTQPKPANPSMIMSSPHVAYQGPSVREQFGSGEQIWKSAFALAENVRFTRTPENELMRLRAKLIEEFGAEEEQPVNNVVKAADVTPATATVATLDIPVAQQPAGTMSAQQPVGTMSAQQPASTMPAQQPSGTMPAQQQLRAAPALRGPSSVIVAARLRLPVVPVAPHVEAVEPLEGVAVTPVVSVIPQAEVVNPVVSHLMPATVVTVAAPAVVTAPENVQDIAAGHSILQLAHLSDFAFWEFAGLPEIETAAETVAIPEIEAVVEAVIPVSEPLLAPIAETSSILSMFRTVEWRAANEKLHSETVAEVAAEPVETVMPVEVAAPANVVEPELTASVITQTVSEEVQPQQAVPASPNPFLSAFNFGFAGYGMTGYAMAQQTVSLQPATVAEPVSEPAIVTFSEAQVVETESATVTAQSASTAEELPYVPEPAFVPASEPVIEPIQEQIAVPEAMSQVSNMALQPAPAPRIPSASINLSIFSPTAIETGTPQSSEGYAYPPRALLQEPVYKDGAIISQEMLQRSAGLLESILEDFGVRGEIIHVRPGPVVTLYEFEPAPGVKSSRVIGLADDIARSMSALSARVAVVPGRNVIGIELPNAIRETVYFRELIESPAFESTSHRLALCLGKTIGGEPVVAELAKMPHLLVAGTTGSGKSVAINTMILSLLYRLKPEECRLIMIDPKMLELSIYDGIPHLLTPVVTDPKKAVVALKWTVREMEERYRKMSRLGVRNIDGYNARAAAAREKGETVTCTVQAGFDKGTGEILYEEQEMDLTPMPYIVVIVDEMADLMMVAGKEIEGAIQRLAQMARAAGIHLIMATQRPSVDVITGTIKANFPTRISFQVTSKIDSRTILGEQGAEQLLGQGDMLHMAGGGRIVRVHGPFVSDEEVEKVVNHLKEQGRPDYLSTVTADEDENDAADDDTAVFDKSDMASEDGDDLYEKAVKVVLRDKKCSTSYIQRRLSIGYNRAASLVERMEQEGLVGAANHVGKREIIGQNDGH